MEKVDIPTIKLNNGINIPALGVGTWLGLDDSGNFLYESYPQLIEALSFAIDVGYRHIDTAHLYRVEPEIGLVVNKKIKEGVVKREDLFITTKVWKHNHREADAIASIQASLRRMNLDYVDQALVHWPMSATTEGVDQKIDYLETWRGFEKALEMGLTKSIGVSNFNVEQLKRLLANCKVPPVSNQVEINLNLGQKELVDFCQSHNILVVAYSPFGTMVPGRMRPNSPEPKHQRGIIPIPKTVTKSRLIENASIFDFKLDADDINTIAKFDVNYRTVEPVFWQNLQNYPFDKVPEELEIPIALRLWKNGAKADID